MEEGKYFFIGKGEDKKVEKVRSIISIKYKTGKEKYSYLSIIMGLVGGNNTEK